MVLVWRRLADHAHSAQFGDHDRVGDAHDQHGHEKGDHTGGGVVEALGGPRHLGAAGLVGDEHDRPTDVVAVHLGEVGPAALGVLAIQVAGQSDAQRERPDEHYAAHDVAFAHARAQRMNDADVAIARNGGQSQHARHHARHLHVRVELAEERTEHPILVHAVDHLHPDARAEYGQIAHGQVEYEVVGGARQQRSLAAYGRDEEAIADERDEHEHHVESEARRVEQVRLVLCVRVL